MVDDDAPDTHPSELLLASAWASVELSWVETKREIGISDSDILIPLLYIYRYIPLRFPSSINVLFDKRASKLKAMIMKEEDLHEIATKLVKSRSYCTLALISNWILRLSIQNLRPLLFIPNYMTSKEFLSFHNHCEKTIYFERLCN